METKIGINLENTKKTNISVSLIFFCDFLTRKKPVKKLSQAPPHLLIQLT